MFYYYRLGYRDGDKLGTICAESMIDAIIQLMSKRSLTNLSHIILNNCDHDSLVIYSLEDIKKILEEKCNMMTWEQAAAYCEEVYGVYVSYDEDDRYFICPECEEPILEEDWPDEDLQVCPVCEFDFLAGDITMREDDPDWEDDCDFDEDEGYNV